MTPNLEEFLKVLTIVFSTSGTILFLRHLIVNYEEEEPKELDNRFDLNFRNQSPDFIDYDGMGNQGRFPVINKRNK
tara:strand:- start:306 stop:533 length:228 start_codon:yes stop_codon:yes gene_type:complete